MKWNEIPKFKEYGISNPANMGFIGYVEFIKEEIVKYNLQMNPDFQRGHVWTTNQQIAWLEFFLKGGKSGRDFYFNWNKLTDEYVCVDGLQRTTALQLFVKDELKVFDQYFSEFGFGRESVWTALPEYSVNVYVNNLSSEKEVLEWYIDMNSGGTPHTAEEIDKVKKMINDLQ